MSALLLVSALTVGALAIAGWVINVAHSAPNLNSLHPHLPGSPSEVYASDGTLLGYITSTSIRTPVPASAIPQRLREATVAIEDRRFYQHGALDYQGILRAAVKDALKGGNGGLQGASTLTMQLVDNTYLPNTYRDNHNLQYKIVQAKLAEQLESEHSKNWILTNYLNDVPYGTLGGQTAYGVGAASQLFFDKPVSKLTLAQAALLAGLPQAPSQYNPFIDKAAALHRRAEVLQAMANAHYITQAQADRAAQRKLQVKNGLGLFQGRKDPYVFDFVVQQAEHDLCPQHPNHCAAVRQGGLKIYSTIDLRKEAIAQQAIDDHASLLASEGGPGVAAALTSIDPLNGHIEAIANSSSYSQTSFDYATQADRQTGSAFKLFALMTLIHDYNGNPNSTYYVSKQLNAGWLPLAPAWSVATDTHTYAGAINITHATIISDNTVFAQLVADEGMTKFNAMAHAMGITSPLDDNPAEVLGGLTIGVTTLQMADAYGTVAGGGVHYTPTAVDRIVFPDGSTRSFATPPHQTVFPYNEAYTATQVLKQVITNPSGTGTAANYGCPAAGKTGTAENLDNAYFAGYTPRMSTAVWVGNPTGNVPMINGFGGVLAAPIWHQYMQEASGGYCGDWAPPSTPFTGTAFFGPHAASGSASTIPGTGTTTTTTGNGTGTTTGTGTGQTGATNGGAGVTPTGGNQYNNPTL
ncbi:MAG TPA: transglycosylase domain-containing protein [Solirubrobacteraceae bacterium]|nr:transglycosylase domain-containing protein [Solirubrobacteraceae bacterium]